MKTFSITSIAAATLVGSTMAASAALLDFTADASYDVQSGSVASGTLADGNTWEITPTPATGTLTYETSDAPAGATPPLTGDNDGIGIDGDELTFPKQMLTLTFNNTVKISTLYFLDLFLTGDHSSGEIALVSVDGGADSSFLATETAGVDAFGFGEFATGLTGKSFTFAVGRTNDGVGRADYALAGVDVATIPLPAGLLLLGTALGGLGIARRRRK